MASTHQIESHNSSYETSSTSLNLSSHSTSSTNARNPHHTSHTSHDESNGNNSIRMLSSSSSAAVSHSFTQLFDQPDLIFDRLKDAIVSTKQLRAFYLDLAAIEQCYCKSVAKLCTSTNFTASESLQTSLGDAVQFVEQLATQRNQWAQHIRSSMCTSLSTLGDNLKKERSQMHSAYSDVKKKLKQEAIACSKAFARYENASKDVEREVRSRSEMKSKGCTEKQLTKQGKRVSDSLSALSSRKQLYSDAVDKHHRAQSSFEKSTDYILQNVEATDLTRLRKMKASLSLFRTTFDEQINNVIEPIKTLEQSINEMHAENDHELFIRCNFTGASRQPMMVFEEIRSPIVELEIKGTSDAITTPLNASAVSQENTVAENLRWTQSLSMSRSTSPTHNDSPISACQSNVQSPLRSAHDGHRSSLYQVMAALNVGNQSSPTVPSPPSPPQPQPSVSQCKFVRTLYDYNEDPENTLSFHSGEFIMITEMLDDNWSRGNLAGREAPFPTSYAQPHAVTCATVKYDFEGTSETELTLHEGDVCYILDASDMHWFWVCDSTGRQGNYPRAYCEESTTTTST